MKNAISTTEVTVKVTLTRESLSTLSYKELQTITKAHNLNTHLGRVPFTKDVLIENLAILGKNDAAIGANTKGEYTKEELGNMSVCQLANIVHELGFDIDVESENLSVDALIDTVLTYKGAGAVFTPPADKDGKAEGKAAALVALNKVPVGICFSYPSSKKVYKVLEQSPKGHVKVENTSTNMSWWWKKEMELAREVVLVNE